MCVCTYPDLTIITVESLPWGFLTTVVLKCLETVCASGPSLSLRILSPSDTLLQCCPIGKKPSTVAPKHGANVRCQETAHGFSRPNVASAGAIQDSCGDAKEHW